MRKDYMLLLATLAVASLGAACPIGTQLTSVEFVNNSTLSVDVQYFYGDDQLAAKATLRLVGEEGNLTVPAGATRTLSLPCDELQAVYIEEASLGLPGGLGPELDTDVLRDGTDFNCGDTVRYTFSGSLIIDFSVDESVN